MTLLIKFQSTYPKNVKIESSDNLLVVGAPKQESAEKILIPNLLSDTSSYLVIDPDGIICNNVHYRL